MLRGGSPRPLARAAALTGAAVPSSVIPAAISALFCRPARHADADVIADIIARSAAELSVGRYDAAQIAMLRAHVFGVDTQLIADGTYWIAERDGRAVGCGGWSRRGTLFGGDAMPGRDAAPLDPAQDPARIRAFFTHPAAARQGVARALYAECEAAAAEACFASLALMATLPGVPFYASLGFVPGEPITHLAGGVAVPFIPMGKRIAPQPVQSGAVTGEDPEG